MPPSVVLQNAATPNAATPSAATPSVVPQSVVPPSAVPPSAATPNVATQSVVPDPNVVRAVTQNEEGDRSVVADQSAVVDRSVLALNVVQAVIPNVVVRNEATQREVQGATRRVAVRIVARSSVMAPIHFRLAAVR